MHFNDLIKVILSLLLNSTSLKEFQSEIAQKICELNGTTLNENDKSASLTILHRFDEIQNRFCLHSFLEDFHRTTLLLTEVITWYFVEKNYENGGVRMSYYGY